jgi:hypothetical protein
MVFKIEKEVKGAEILFPDGTRLTGRFFVSHTSKKHTGPECIVDLFSEEDTYIPFELEEGDIVLLQKKNIVMLRLEEKEVNRNLPFLKRIGAQISLVPGQTLQGEVYVDLPESRSRLSDFLNYCREFFYIEDGNEEYLVNSEFVKYVRPISNDRQPPEDR